MNAHVDVTDLLKSIGIRLGKEHLRALFDEMHQQKMSPTKVCEFLVDAEAKERARRNLDRRAHAAALV